MHHILCWAEIKTPLPPTPPPKMSTSESPRTCEYITLYGKGDFEDMIMDLEVGKLSWVVWVDPKCNHGVLVGGK